MCFLSSEKQDMKLIFFVFTTRNKRQWMMPVYTVSHPEQNVNGTFDSDDESIT